MVSLAAVLNTIILVFAHCTENKSSVFTSFQLCHIGTKIYFLMKSMEKVADTPISMRHILNQNYSWFYILIFLKTLPSIREHPVFFSNFALKITIIYQAVKFDCFFFWFAEKTINNIFKYNAQCNYIILDVGEDLRIVIF